MRYTVIIYFIAFLLCLAGLLLPGCAQHYQVDPAFQPYVTSFIQADPQHRPITNLIIQWGAATEPNVDASCLVGEFTTPTIDVDTAQWAELNGYEQETLLFHELGHCVLYRKHNSGRIGDRAVSIMNPMLLPWWDYLNYREAYITELFQYENEINP